MRIIEPKFSDLHFFDASIKCPIMFDQRAIVIQIKNLGIMQKNPVNGSDEMVFVDCDMIFEGVCCSRRTIYEYVNSSRQGGFKEKRDIIDGPFCKVDGKTKKFEFEGLLEDPPAWIHSWVICAERCLLKIIEYGS